MRRVWTVVRVVWPILRWGILHGRPRVVAISFRLAGDVWRTA